MKRSDVPDIDVLRAAAAFHADGPTIDEALPHVPPKVLQAKLWQMTFRGLIDYGVSARTAWPTAAGKRLLIEAGHTEELRLWALAKEARERRHAKAAQ